MRQVAMPRALKTCSVPGCPTLVPAGTGRCTTHTRQADRARGTARQRGYNREHETRFRQGVLDQHPVCQLCHAEPSIHADHWPLSRRDLVARGLDPNDPKHGRGLGHRCHSRETAAHQPGGWAAQ